MHTFHGDFVDGHKTNGTLNWKDNGFDYEYIGTFNEDGYFDGKGSFTLKQEYSRILMVFMRVNF